MRRLVASVSLLVVSALAHADGLVIGGGSPRSIGRAGTGTASDDGGGALLVNPAAMARRDTTRVQVGAAFVDDSIDWREAVSAPPARDQSGSTPLPFAAIESGVGDWVLGAAVMTSAAGERSFVPPGRNPPSSFGLMFDDRYAGLAGAYRRDTVTFGVAHRLGDAIAIGGSVGVSRVEISETRAIWANHAKGAAIDANHDVVMAMDGIDWGAPSAVAGVLIAPEDTHVELAGSIGWTSDAHVSGDAQASRWAVDQGIPPGVQIVNGGGRAGMDVRQPITVRTGARWLGERWIVEVGGDLWIYPKQADETAWRIDGVRIVDSTNVAADVTSVPSRLSTRSHGALRGALDVELIEGFLWATCGYAYTTSSTSTAHLSTTFGELGGHTAAVGLEATAGGFTISLGWARQWSTKRALAGSVWQHDNPFPGGDDYAIPGGTYDASSDVIGLGIEVEH